MAVDKLKFLVSLAPLAQRGLGGLGGEGVKASSVSAGTVERSGQKRGDAVCAHFVIQSVI